MRWEQLFEDLSASVDAEDRADFDAEVADLARAERAVLSLGDRLRAHVGRPLRLHLVDGEELLAGVVEVGRDWIGLAVRTQTRHPTADGGHAGPEVIALVPLSAVAGVEGLTRASAPAPDADAPPVLRAGLGVALRALARDRAYVRVTVRGGSTVAGTVDRVGADHVDVAMHPPDQPRRPAAVTGVRTVPRSALVVVRCAPTG